ncbi:GldG family protein [Paludisphaera borealis]|nr:GldG family protein [Paludisphaera borealis]
MLSGLSMFLNRAEIWVGALAVAAFLVLYWTLRGAPPGQSATAEDDDDAPRSGYRDRVIAAVVTGLLLILAGAYVAATRGVPWSLPLFALGFGMVLALAMVNQRYRHSSPSLRRTIEYSNAILNTALLAGVLIVANVIAFRYGGHVIDLTRERAYSLSSLTMNQVGSLDRPLTFHLIYGRGARAGRQLDRIAQLLELYRTARPDMVKIESVNPFTDLERTEDLAKRAPDLAVMQGGGVLIEFGEGEDAKYVAVGGQEMFDAPPPERSPASLDRFESTFKGEDALTSALIRIREGRTAKVAFLVGHGEPRLDDLNPNGPGLGLWKARMTSNGYDVTELNLLEASVPDDVELVVVAGPKDAFKPVETARLKAYADRGGPVLAMLGNTEPTGLDDFLLSFNLELGKGLVIDPQLNFNHNMQLVHCILKGGVGHPITDSLGSERSVLIANGAPIEILGTKPQAKELNKSVDRRFVPTPIVKSGSRSWAETDLKNPRPRFDQDVDQAGPIVVGVAVVERGAEPAAATKPRLVLFSTRSIAENIVQGIEPTNLDLVMNAVSWLRERPNAVGITPKTHVALTLTADPLLRWRLVVVPTVAAVLTIVGLGGLVYVVRHE